MVCRAGVVGAVVGVLTVMLKFTGFCGAVGVKGESVMLLVVVAFWWFGGVEVGGGVVMVVVVVWL